MTSEKKVGYHPGGSVPRRSRTTNRRRPTGRTIPTRRVSNRRDPLNQNPKPPTTQTSRQKAIAAVKARSARKKAEILKNFNSLTPAQKTAMKQRQRTNQATPTKTTGTLGNPKVLPLPFKQRQRTNQATPTITSAQKKILKQASTAMQKAKPLSASQKQMFRTKPRVGSTVARRRAAMAKRKGAAMSIGTPKTKDRGTL